MAGSEKLLGPPATPPGGVVALFSADTAASERRSSGRLRFALTGGRPSHALWQRRPHPPAQKVGDASPASRHTKQAYSGGFRTAAGSLMSGVALSGAFCLLNPVKSRMFPLFVCSQPIMDLSNRHPAPPRHTIRIQLTPLTLYVTHAHLPRTHHAPTTRAESAESAESPIVIRPPHTLTPAAPRGSSARRGGRRVPEAQARRRWGWSAPWRCWHAVGRVKKIRQPGIIKRFKTFGGARRPGLAAFKV